MNYQEIHRQALQIAERFRRSEHELIQILQKIDEKRVFQRLGYASLFVYATKALGLSEANAYNFMTVARKSVQVPELAKAVADGKITVCKARKIAPVINKENSQQWLNL